EEDEEDDQENEEDDDAASTETASSPEDFAAAMARAFAPQLAALTDAINGVNRQLAALASRGLKRELAALASRGLKREPDALDDAEREERRKRRREGTPVAGPSNDPDRADRTPPPLAGDAEVAGALDAALNGPRAGVDNAAVLAELELDAASKEEEAEVDPTDPKGKKPAK
ncbi:hypothetical protein EXIGLDRAFT_781722, partial [Exidia glandulosa HHB12029]